MCYKTMDSRIVLDKVSNWKWSFIYLALLFLMGNVYGAEFYVSNGTSILRYNTRQVQAEAVYSKRGSVIIGLAVDIADDTLFWSDISADYKGIYSSDVNGQNVKLIISNIQEVNGLSVDWASKHIYWTDAKKRTIEIANYDGTGSRVLLSLTSNEEPRGIVVDPMLGFVFWADQWNGRIERAKLNGDDRKIIVNREVYWPNQLAISKIFRRLYWVEASPRSSIMSCDFDGIDIKKEQELVNITSGNPSFGLVVIGNKAIFSTWFNNAIYSTLVGTSFALWEKEISHLGTDKLYSLVTLDASIQPRRNHPCGKSDRGGCSHLCLPSGWGTDYVCSCPSFTGLALDSDKATCTEPKEMVFYTFQDLGEVGFMDPNARDTPQTNILGRSHSPSSVTYDPVHEMVYWSNRERPSTIYRSDRKGQDKEMFLDEDDGLGFVDGLTLDWVGRRLYFTNSGQSEAFLGGSTYTWQRVEMVSLDSMVHKTVVRDVVQPKRLAVDYFHGFLYIVDGGDHPRLLRTNLDGSFIKTLIDRKVLTNPLAVSLFGDKVYIADGTADKNSAAVIMFSVTNSSIVTLTKFNSNILDIAATGQAVYISSYNSDQGEGRVFVLDLNTSERREIDVQGRVATALFYSKRTDVAAPFEDSCEDAYCSSECIRVSSHTPPFRCVCPENSALMMTNDGATCSRPENFVLVADLNVIQIVSLDPDTQNTPHTVYFGNAHSDIVSVVYDTSTDSVLWIDRSKIMMVSLTNPTQPQVLLDSGHFALNGLALDEDKQKLYWTSYDKSIHGRIMRMKLKHGAKSTKSIVTVEKAVPKALLVLPDKKLMFWTEHADLSQQTPEGAEIVNKGSVQRAHLSGSHQRPLLTTGLVWPSSLAVYEDRLYVADAVGKLVIMDLDGSNIQTLSYFSGLVTGIYDFKFVENFLLYSNLNSRTIRMVDMETGWNVTVATNLTRPTSIAVFHPTNLKASSRCDDEDHKCSHTCVAVPRSYHCTCPPAYNLLADHVTCHKVDSLWEESDAENCPKVCSDNGVCARAIPTLRFQCVCREGYHGNGTYCQGCSVNHFKPSLGNDPCTRCDEGASTHGGTAAISCSCRNGQAIPARGSCADLNFDIRSTVKMLPLPPVTHPPKPTGLWKDDSEEKMIDDPRFSDDYWGLSVQKERNLRGQPYFNNCPSGKTLKVFVPSYKNKARLPVTWTAHDAFGSELQFISNFQINNGAVILEWWANGEDGKQAVVMEATDRYGQKVICKFYVLVEDLEPPVFTYCPHDLSVKSYKLKERVLWSKPEASDNIGVERITGTLQSGSKFSQGVTVVNFTAVDQAGNRGYCNFSVHIYQDEQSCDFPKIKNGAFVCSKELGAMEESCYIVCEPLYAVNPLEMFSRKFTCDNHDALKRFRENLKHQEACLSAQIPTIVTQEFTIWFKGPCESDDPDLHNELSSSVVEYLKAHTVCPARQCQFSNVSIECEYTETNSEEKTENRMKGSYLESILFLVKWNVTIDNSTGFEDGDVESVLTNIRMELIRLLPDLQLQVDSHKYTAVPHSVKTSSLIWSCVAGKTWSKEGCVSCPPGSMYKADPSQQCQTCPAGTYQPYDKQEECFPCADDKTSEPGSISSSKCITMSSLNDMSKFLIITACTFGFVFLVMAIILYFQYKRQQKNTQTRQTSSGDGQKYITPNIYAAPPPLPRVSVDSSTKTPPPKHRLKEGHLYSNHDYEDVGYNTGLSSLTDVSARTVYQNDFTNLSPPGSPRLLASPVTDRAIYNGDFRNFSPSPRTNSLRHHQRGQNFHLYDQ